MASITANAASIAANVTSIGSNASAIAANGANIATLQSFVLGNGFTPATLPTTGVVEGAIAYITGGIGNGRDDCMVYWDSVNWRKIQNGTIQA